jgi:hypothetical protein
MNQMNAEHNDPGQKTSPGASGRLKLAAAAVTLAIAGVVAATAFKGPPAHTVVVPEAQGGLINEGPPSNAPAAAVSSPSQIPVAVATAGNPAAGATTAPAAGQDGYVHVGFDKLAGFPARLHWELVDAVRIKGVQKMMDPIPGDIKALNDSKIAVRGFMLPIKLEDGLVTEFLLMRTQARCCFGLPIQVNELLTVHMAKTGVKSLMDQPVTVYGRLHVSESRDNTGALTSIYSLDGDKMDPPEGM